MNQKINPFVNRQLSSDEEKIEQMLDKGEYRKIVNQEKEIARYRRVVRNTYNKIRMSI